MAHGFHSNACHASSVRINPLCSSTIIFMPYLTFSFGLGFKTDWIKLSHQYALSSYILAVVVCFRVFVWQEGEHPPSTLTCFDIPTVKKHSHCMAAVTTIPRC